MAEADWTVLTNSIGIASVDRGATAGVTPPNGGGTFVHGFNSVTTVNGASGLFTNQVNFAPMTSGGRVTGAMKRAPSGGPTGFAPMLYIGLQGPAVDDSGYLLGLSDEDPHRIVLRKGQIDGGLPAVVGSNGVLDVGTDTYNVDTWVHLRLDMVVNLNGDVVLNCFENDLDTNPVSAPVWTAIPGIDQFIDDALGVNSGSQPFINGRAGFAFQVADVARRAFFDQITIARQL